VGEVRIVGIQDMRKTLAEKLRLFRENSGLTAKAVGEAIGKSEKTISAREHGRGQPDADKLIELCSLYNVTVSDFFDQQPSTSAGNNSKSAESSGRYQNLISICESLNEDGLQKVIEYASDLASSDKYRRNGHLQEKSPSASDGASIFRVAQRILEKMA
jgi:repressor LexA